jgi:flagellar hook-associated protein FlgK
MDELSGYLELRVQHNLDDGSVQVQAGGILIVGMDSANLLQAATRPDGGVMIISPNGGILRPQGGSIAALDELAEDIIPGVAAGLDGLVAGMVERLNALHATSTSQSMKATSFQADFTVPTAHLDTNLDDALLAQVDGKGAGIPPLFSPSFTDAAGNATTRNLTINVRDTVTGEARKYTLRYDPAQGNGTRTLSDLVSAINTGEGGGFQVIPADGLGVPGVNARAVAVEDGWQLQISADANLAIDFSPALDLQPGRRQWSGPDVAIDTVTAIPVAVGDRLQFEVVDSGGSLSLEISTRNASNGASNVLGSIAASAAGVFNLAGIGGTGELQITLGAGTFRAGDRFVVGLDNGGAVLQKGSSIAGTYTQPNERVATDANFSVRGRYTGSLPLLETGSATTPYSTWSMQVITAGTIGAKASANPANPQPPVVEFSYWSGTAAAPLQQTVRRTLDQSLPAGTPVQIADGVFAVFEAGTLTATDPGEAATFTVDAEPDQAGLLSAFGIAGMFTGSTAASLRVSQRLVDDPTQLNTGLTRSEGDNSNVLRLLAAREEKLYNDGGFAFDDTYNAVLSEVGVRIRQAERLDENQTNIRAALENQRQQVSGVNIDEEVGLMILQQQAYTAAARIITFARENIDTLMELAR